MVRVAHIIPCNRFLTANFTYPCHNLNSLYKRKLSNLRDIADLAAFIQSLVVGLCSHYENGTQLPYLDSWIIFENKWRATRYGMDAKLITDADGTQVEIKDVMKGTIKALEPEINELNVSESMDRIINRIEEDNSYCKEQINIYNKTNSFKEVIKNNISQLKR